MKTLQLMILMAITWAQQAVGADSYAAWQFSGSVFILTTPEGANLPEGSSVDDFPALLRLHRDFFDFKQAQPNGEDLRISSSTGDPLAFQIELWDAENGVASVWIRVPKIDGNSRQEIKLHWGNREATSESNGQKVFNASNGYLSVWHMNDPVRDEVGTLSTTDSGTASTSGVIGDSRHFSGGHGIFGGDKISNYPTGSNPHTTEGWFRIEKPNATVLAWGNEEAQGKVVMQLRSPPHISMDCYFSDANVSGNSRVALSQWMHVAHTYQKGESRIYVNGLLDGETKRDGNPLKIKSPEKLWLGGWYNNYEFVGDIDEVRISQVSRSADWIKLEYENQKPNQTLVGIVVQPGKDFRVSQSLMAIGEGQSKTVTVEAGGAQKIYWVLKQKGGESVVATDSLSYTFNAGRVVGARNETLQVKAIYPNAVKTKDIAITISDDVPEPAFSLAAPATWDGRQTIAIAPQFTNLDAMREKGAGELNLNWTVDGVAVIKQIATDKLILKRAQGVGKMQVTVAIDNGGEQVTKAVSIVVSQPATADPWVEPIPDAFEQPEDNQFFARNNNGHNGMGVGTLTYSGTLAESADSVFVRLYADDQLIATEIGKLTRDKNYSVSAKLKPGLIKYRSEFGSKIGNREAVLHTANNLVCGDAYLIDGQSNAVATDFGKVEPPQSSDWLRTFGATDNGQEGSRLKLWAPAEARSPGGKSEIGYWGMELGRRLVESEKVPICIINGAVGGTRIDQHQRDQDDPTDANTIYGRLLWRVQQAKLTHGIRAIIWHQGENDQGADGPTGGYGHETYRQFFVDMAAAWKEDYPNVQHYYVFQIWPKSCSMGIDGSDNKLREVQRTLPALFSNLSVMSTLGVKPPGGCHFPAAGYAEFARLISPLIERDIYQRAFDQPITPPNLRRAFFSNDQRDELILEFDQPIAWSDQLVNQFYLDGEANQVVSGSATENRLALKLKTSSKANKVTYLDSDNWNPDILLYGKNGIAALTFCDVSITAP